MLKKQSPQKVAPLKMVRVTQPKQKGDVDCAVFALLFAQRMIDGHENPSNFTQVRSG